MVYFNFRVAIVFAIALVPGYLYFVSTRRQHEAASANALLED
ncbi:hypothetical protein [Paraburkholderia gardini]|nr:hypothetical protein [Paraburkholderia gardini]